MPEESPDRIEESAGTAAEPAAPRAAAPAPPRKQGFTASQRLAALIIVLVVVGAGAIWGLEAWRYSQTHVSTDDAYVTGNLVNVSPVISGTLRELMVDEGDQVHRGQLIARLSSGTEDAAVRQSEAGLEAARTQVPQAQSNLSYQQLSTDAAVRRAQEAIAAQQARTSGAQQQVTLTSSTVRNQVEEARSKVSAAEAQAAQSDAGVATARAGVGAAREGVTTAERAAATADARIGAARAEADRTAKDVTRYRQLVDEQAISRQQFDVAQAAAASAQSSLKAAQEDAARAHAAVGQAREGVTQAEAMLTAAQKAASASHRQVDVARSGVALAQAGAKQVGVQQANVRSNVNQTAQAQADLAAAEAGKAQIDLRRKQVATAEAQVKQAEASLANAKIAQADTYIYAPTDGTVVRKTANPGVSLQPGQTIVTMTQGERVWVTANFKETQLKDVRTGQAAEVEVDTFPGRVFKGRVQSVYEATGAATSLLPPDNATGNFTKVVQRVPVRIELLPAGDREDKKYARASDIQALRQGMSVTATIDTAARGH